MWFQSTRTPPGTRSPAHSGLGCAPLRAGLLGRYHLCLGLACLLLAGATAGCGYTVLKMPGSGVGGADSTATKAQEVGSHDPPAKMPAFHPRLLDPQEWPGCSFLDDILGEDDPLRFEYVREDPAARLPTKSATLRARFILGGEAQAEVWELRMDRFGHLSMLHGTGQRVLEAPSRWLGTEVGSFRLEHQSECALRIMILELLPLDCTWCRSRRLEDVRRLPPSLWPDQIEGWIEIEYHIETWTATQPSEWPGGTVRVPLDPVRLLVETWSEEPPLDLRRAVWAMVREEPHLLDLARIVEAIVLAWTVENPDPEASAFPVIRIER